MKVTDFSGQQLIGYKQNQMEESHADSYLFLQNENQM